MKRFILIITLVLVTSFVLVGCGSDEEEEVKNPLVGTWALNTYVYTFNEDMTCSYGQMECTYHFEEEELSKEEKEKKIRKGSLSILYKGNTAAFKTKYHIEGNKLTIKDSLDRDVVYTRK